MDFLSIQDGGWLASLSSNILEAKHVIKKVKNGYYRYFQGYYRKVKKKIYCHIPLNIVHQWATAILNWKGSTFLHTACIN